jgi:hypothetical protein
VIFCNKLTFYGEKLLAPHLIPKLEDHPLSAVYDCLFNIFAAGGRFLNPQPEEAPCRGDNKILPCFKLNLCRFALIFFFWLYSPNLGLSLPPWNSPFHFGFLDLRQSVGLLGRVISSSQDLYLYTNTEKHTQTLNINALGWIPIHDPGFRANEDSACLKPLGYRDRLFARVYFNIICCIMSFKIAYTLRINLRVFFYAKVNYGTTAIAELHRNRGFEFRFWEKVWYMDPVLYCTWSGVKGDISYRYHNILI